MVSEAMQRVIDRIKEIQAQRRAETVSRTLPERRSQLDSVSQPAPEDVTVTPVDAAGATADWLAAPHSDPDRRVLYLHGGGFTSGSRLSHRRLASDIARASRCAVLIIDYRLAPEHPFPAALEDAVAAFGWMRDHGPAGDRPATGMFVAGDSAGGGLVLSMMLALQEIGESLPGGAVLMSPWTDLTLTADSLTRERERDYFMSGDTLPEGVRHYLGDHDPRDPLASPLFGDLGGFPPLFMQVGECEILIDDTTRVADRAREAGVEVTVEIEPEAFHVYQSVAGLFPEAQAAVDRIGAFLRTQ